MARNVGAVFHSEAQVVGASGENQVHIQQIDLQKDGSVTNFQATLHASTIIVAAGQMLLGKELFQWKYLLSPKT